MTESTAPSEDVLFHRALDRTAGRADWSALRARAAADPDLWRRLADGLEDDGRVTQALTSVTDVADRVELPPERRTLRAGVGAGTLLGWAAAALFLVGWLNERSATHSEGPSRERTAITVPTRTAEVAPPPLTTVSTRGEIVTELPARMLDTRPATDGEGYDVLVLRRTVERRRVDALYRLAEDEHGDRAPVPVRWTPPDDTEQM